MSRPLNYAILKYFTQVEKASVIELLGALRKEYSSYKAFNKKSIVEALMTAESNGLIQECGADIVDGELIVYYLADSGQKQTINNYIK